MMPKLEMNEPEAKLLLDVLERYRSHLEVEIVRTHRREFRDALKERENTLGVILERLKGITK
jgi:hypothetical protein